MAVQKINIPVRRAEGTRTPLAQYSHHYIKPIHIAVNKRLSFLSIIMDSTQFTASVIRTTQKSCGHSGKGDT